LRHRISTFFHPHWDHNQPYKSISTLFFLLFSSQKPSFFLLSEEGLSLLKGWWFCTFSGLGARGGGKGNWRTESVARAIGESLQDCGGSNSMIFSLFKLLWKWRSIAPLFFQGSFLAESKNFSFFFLIFYFFLFSRLCEISRSKSGLEIFPAEGFRHYF